MMVYVVAAPQKIIDSYYALMQILGLEAVFIEPGIISATRVLNIDTNHAIPSVIIDFGTRSADISVFDSHVMVTGAVQAGGDLFTDNIMQALSVSQSEAVIIKTKYGLGLSKKQTQIVTAVEPLLAQTIREIKRMIRYYEERGGNSNKIGQVITMGGGANMPGLSDYLTSHMRIPVRTCNPWQNLDLEKLQPPSLVEKSTYVTAAGLASISPKDLFT